MFGGTAVLLQNVSAYGRVSSEEQAEKGTIENQIDFGEKYCDLHEIKLEKWYLDDGVTGTIPLEERKDGKRLLEDARAGKIKTLLIYKLDRLGRSARIILNSVHELEKYGVKIRSMTEPFDTSDPSGRFLLTILAGVADLERETILQRMWLGANRAAKKGKWLGGIVPYGYRVDEGYLIPSTDPIPGFELSEVDVIILIFRLTIERHMNTYKIADYLNALGIPPSYAKDGRKVLKGKRKENTAGIWYPGRIRAILISSTYKGIHEYGRRSQKDRDIITRKVPAIVTEEMSDKAAIVLKENRLEAFRNKKHDYLLRGLIRCGDCGRNYTGIAYSGAKNEEKGYYRCHAKSIYLGPGGKKCTSKNVPQEWLETLVWSDIVHFVSNPADLLNELKTEITDDTSYIEHLNQEKDLLSKTLSQKELEKQSILDLFRKKLITMEDVELQLQKINTESMQLNERLSQLNKQPAPQFTGEERLSKIQELLTYLQARIHEDILWEEKREIVKMLVKRVIVETIYEDKSPTATIYIEYSFQHSESHGCLCGWLGDSSRSCTCTPWQISHYRSRISGPLLDRFDLHIEVPRVKFDELHCYPESETSADVQNRVLKARQCQWTRLGGSRTNAEMGAEETSAFCRLDSAGEQILRSVFERQQLSARSHDRILRVARTIADLDSEDSILSRHLAEALQYRALDRSDAH